jgi:ubiquitin-conjugating enzyme E2 Q
VKGREVEYLGSKEKKIPSVRLDDAHPITMGTMPVQIPEPSHKIEQLLNARLSEFLGEDFDADDQMVFNYTQSTIAQSQNNQASSNQAPESSSQKRKLPLENDWKHDEEYVRAAMEHLLPPPEDSSISADYDIAARITVNVEGARRSETS